MHLSVHVFLSGYIKHSYLKRPIPIKTHHHANTPQHYIERQSGEIEIQPEAFSGGERPSVDIAKINCFKPKKTKNVAPMELSVSL